jgi:drug/metabolite transporter (DMT)-like permease
VLELDNVLQLWIINILVALLAALNTIAWGYCIKEVEDPELSINFLFKLIFNKWFIMAMIFAFTASILGYAVLQKMGVLAGRFFLAIQSIAIVLTASLVLGERLSISQWLGIILIIVGVILIGR